MKRKILFIARLLTGLIFINAGLNKFFNYMPVPDDMPEEALKMFTAMMEIAWLMPLIATVEIIGGILFITNRYQTIGALMLFPIMTGIILVHLTILPSGLPMALVLLAVLVWSAVEKREKLLALVR